MTLRALGLTTLLAAWPAAGLAETVDTVRKSFAVQPGGKLAVDVSAGTLEVTVAPGKELTVEVVRKASAESKEREAELLREHAVTFDKTGETVTIRSPRRRSSNESLWSLLWKTRERLNAHYTIAVPERFDADLETAGGAIKVTGLKGTLRAETAGGGLRFTNVTGPIDAETSGGGIRLEGCDGAANVRTSGGGIDVHTHRGDLTADTSGGGILVEGIAGNLDAETSGGSIRAAWKTPPTGACRLSTSGGGVSVTLPEKAAVDLDASTSGGDVRSDLAVDGTKRRDHVKGRVNGGGPLLELRTSGGNIRVTSAGAAVSSN